MATVSKGYNIQFWQQPPPFTGVHMTTVKDPVKMQSDKIKTADPRPQTADWMFKGSVIQDVTHRLNLAVHCPKRVVHDLGSQGHVLPYPDLARSQALPNYLFFCLLRTGIPNQVPTVWYLPSPTGVYQGSGDSSSSTERSENTPIFGWSVLHLDIRWWGQPTE